MINMLTNHMAGLELQKATHINDIIEKSRKLSQIPNDVAHSQLFDSMLRDIELKNSHLRDIEIELRTVVNYRNIALKG